MTTTDACPQCRCEADKMTLLDTHPYRFGWRIWFALPRIARLVTPLEAVMLAGHNLDARCETGHRPPVLACTCGVHYWPRMGITNEHNHNDPPIAITFGVALGPITPDRIDTTALRSRRHQVLAMFLPAQLHTVAHRFAEQHRLPVFIGISESLCAATAAAVVPDRGAEWFAELADQPPSEPDSAARHYNGSIISIRRQRRRLDVRAARHIEETFDSDDTEQLVGGLV